MGPFTRHQLLQSCVTLVTAVCVTACTGESPGLGALGEMLKSELPESSPSAETHSTGSTSSTVADIRMTSLAPGVECSAGGILVEVLSTESNGSDNVLFKKVECGSTTDVSNESRETEWKPCTRNGQVDCITTQTFAAADSSRLLPENIKTGITVAGVEGTFTDRPADCVTNGQVGCVTSFLYQSADLSGLVPSNIRYGQTVAGITGSYPSASSPLEGSAGIDLPSLSEAVPAGQYQFFQSDGTRVVGSISDAGIIVPAASDQTFSHSLYRGFVVSGDAELRAEHLLSGVTLFGVAGNVALPPASKVQKGSFFGPGGTAVEGEILNCESSGASGCIATTDYKAYAPCTADGQTACAANSTYQAWAPVTASVSSSVNPEDEGQTVTFTIETTNIPDGSQLKYILSGTGIEPSDVTNGLLSGTASVLGNTASVNVPLAIDYVTEGPENLSITVYRQLATTSTTIEDIEFPATLMLHFDGSNGGTTLLDSSQNNWSMNVFGDARLSSLDAKFGSAGLTLDGVGDYITTPADSAFLVGTSDFTIDFWCNPSTVSDNDGVFTFGDTLSGLALSLYQSNWYLSNSGGGGTNMAPATAGQWTHVAITRASNQVRMFLNGAQVGSTLNWNTNFTGNQLRIGYYYTNSFPFHGKLDEFRFINSKAVWTSNFTPPTAPH